MAEIARRAGLRKGSLFHHVKGKEALYVEALSEVVDHLNQQVLAAGTEQGLFEERMDRLGEVVVRFLGHRKNAARLLLREFIDGGPYLQGPGYGAMGATMRASVDLLASRGVGPRGGDGGDARQLVLSMVGLHLFPFAVPDLASDVLGEDIFSEGALARRQAAVLGQVRRLCRVEPEVPGGCSDDEQPMP